ncbi:MAG: class B sortase [Lachnospiraceae bacterium]|nr:class B sortase [Lachnospiraceae bacterium]
MSRKAAVAVISVSVLIIALLTGALIYVIVTQRPQPEDNKTVETVETVEAVETVEEDAVDLIEELDNKTSKRPEKWYGTFESSGSVEDPKDLAKYRTKCPDVYAYIEIPGTDIGYPIAYCEDAVDPFWFTHDIDGNESDSGMIITDAVNSGDLSDTMTLIYGRSPADGTMFSQLERFRDSQFFDSHEYVNIYTDDAELVYRIYACYIDSSDHILANYDFNDPKGFEAYFDHAANVRDLGINIREEVRPSVGDHVIGLITHCDDESKRLFVLAVLDDVRY